MRESPPALSVRHQQAVLDVEARRLARTLSSYGALHDRQLMTLAGARNWSRGRFSQALSRAVDQHLIRSLGAGFYAPAPYTSETSTSLMPRSHDLAEGAAEPLGAWNGPGAVARISSFGVGLTKSDFEQLLELRTGLRRFLGWSGQQAKIAGLTPAKHQLLLAIKGHADPTGPTIGELADYLVLRHHSVVGLVDRAESDGLVRRNPDQSNRSLVRVTLTPVGEKKLDALTEAHLQEIRHLAPTMRALWRELDQAQGEAGTPDLKLRGNVRR
jgi:DNA-binding MarR family transcriptional regulator